MKMNEEQIIEMFKRSKFNATWVLDTDYIKVIDWRPEVGGNLAMRFYVDLAKGNFIVTGDAYNAVFCWYNEFTLKNLREFVMSPEYVAGKMQAGKQYTYNDDDIKEDLKAIKEEIWKAYQEEPENYPDFEDDKEYLERILKGGDYFDNDIIYYCDRPPVFSEFAIDLLEKYTNNDEGHLYHLGERTNFRIYQWCVGFGMAYDQLERVMTMSKLRGEKLLPECYKAINSYYSNSSIYGCSGLIDLVLLDQWEPCKTCKALVKNTKD